MEKTNLEKLPVVTEAQATVRVDEMHKSRVTGDQKAQLTHEIARISNVDPICITLHVRHEQASYERLQDAIKQYEALAQETHTVDLELQLPQTDDVIFQRDCDAFILGLPRPRAPASVSYHDSDTVLPFPSPPPSPPPVVAPRRTRRTSVHPTSEDGAPSSGDAAAAPSLFERAWRVAQAVWRFVSGKSAADATEVRRTANVRNATEALEKAVGRRAVDVASGEELLIMIKEMQWSLKKARALEEQTSKAIDDNFTTAMKVANDTLGKASVRLGVLQSKHLADLERLVAPAHLLEIELDKLDNEIEAAARCGINAEKLMQYHAKHQDAETEQTQRKCAIEETQNTILKLLHNDPAKVDQNRLQNQIECADTLSMEGIAQPELFRLWEVLNDLVLKRAKPGLIAAKEAAVIVADIRECLELEMTFVRPESKGCRVDLRLLCGAVKRAKDNIAKDQSLADDVGRAEETFTVERQRCVRFISALQRLEDAQRRVSCEVCITLHLSGFLQAEITKESLESKLDDVIQNLRAELRKPRILGELIDVKEATAGKNHSPRYLLPRCQRMPVEAFAEPAVAAKTYKRRKRDVDVLSYCWRTPGQPDPDGSTLQHMLCHLRQQTSNEDRLLFVDWPSMPQKDIVGVRSPEDGEKFGRALKQMGSLYASLAATAVLQLQDVADPNEQQHSALKATFESVLVVKVSKGQLLNATLARNLIQSVACGGPILAYWATLDVAMKDEDEAKKVVTALGSSLPGKVIPRIDSFVEKDKSGTKITKWKIVFDVRRCLLELIEALLSRTRVNVAMGQELNGELRLRFENAEAAKRAEEANIKSLIAYPLYNSRSYKERGWPTFESGAAVLAKTHLEHEAERDDREAHRAGNIFTRADAARSKLLRIGAGEFPTIVPDEKIKEGPDAVRQHVEMLLQNVFFTGKGDKDDVIEMLKEYNGKMQHALDTTRRRLQGNEE